jgi:glutathione S-transferase
MLKVLGRVSSINVRKVLWTCAEIGLPFEREDWGIGFRPTRDPAFTALNPNALVPVVIAPPSGSKLPPPPEESEAAWERPGVAPDVDFVLWESNTICRWLAAEHGRTDLLPAAPRGRALVERWMDWQLGDLNNAWRYAFMALVRESPAHRDPAAIAASAVEWNRLMTLLDGHLQRAGPYATGADFTLADVVLGLAAQRWRATPIEHAMLPAVDAYLDRLRARPAFAAAGCAEHP